MFSLALLYRASYNEKNETGGIRAMFAFIPAEWLGKPLGKLLQWMDDHHLFLILPAFGVVLSLGVLCYVHFRTPPQPEPFTL